MDRKAHGEATWALVTNGVTEARVLTHGIRHFLARAKKLIEESDHRDHLYQMAGDLIETVPSRFDKLEACLNKTQYALAKIGESELRDSLSIADRTDVQEAVIPAKSFESMTPRQKAARRIAHRYIQGLED